jgi:hypothetical protein
MMSADINWVLEVLKVLPTVVIGIIAGRIAWNQAEIAKQQKQIAQAKLKLDLFSRRLAVYDAIYAVAEAARDYRSPEDAKQALKELIRLSHESEFLFGRPVRELVITICEKVAVLGKGLSATAEKGSVPAELLPDLRAANAWLKDAPITETFRPYMELSDWK